jgi:replicative DNA helicase
MDEKNNTAISSNQFLEPSRKRSKKPVVNQEIYEHGKIPPQAVDLEEAVLGAMMLEKDALSTVIDVLKAEVFYKKANQIIFSAIKRLFGQAQPVDILTVTNNLKVNGELDEVGGPFYVAQLTSRIASAANVEYHAHIILQKYIQRELIRISSDTIRDAFNDTTDVFDLLDSAEKNLFAVSENNLRRSYEDMQSLVKEAIKKIEAAKNQEGHFSGVASGYTELDRVTAGWQKSDLIVIAARPGMGKTAFVLSMARNVAIDLKKPIAFFSLEMSSIQLVTRLIASETHLPAEKLRKGNLESYEWEQLNAKISNLIEAPLYIDDTPALSIFELRAKCRRLKAQHDIQLVVIDYLQLMSASTDGRTNREQEISTISRSLKALAKELNIPIIALSQLSREVEKRGPSRRPILSDLRESGAIEQDADMVIFIYRAEYYKIDTDEDGNSTAGMAEIIVAKHRNGPLKDIKLRFVSQFARFEDLETSGGDYATALEPNQQFENGSNSYTVPSKMNEMDEDPF